MLHFQLSLTFPAVILWPIIALNICCHAFYFHHYYQYYNDARGLTNFMCIEFQNCISVSVQLQEFDEDVVITLQAKNPQAPQNIVRFDYTVGEFIPIKLGETMIDHLEIEVSDAF